MKFRGYRFYKALFRWGLPCGTILWILIFACIDAFATDYYIKNAGSDINTGLSDAQAWETIVKVTATTFSAGDTIYFNKGDTWNLTYNNYLDFANENGTADNYITIDAYGTGSKPIINAQESISGSWSDEGSDVWSKDMSGTSDISRAWLGDADTLEAVNAAGVDSDKKWFYNTTTDILYVYATEDPDTAYSSVKISRISYCVRFRGVDYFTIQNMDLRGARGSEVNVQNGCSFIIIQDNNFLLSGGEGVLGAGLDAGQGLSNDNITVRRNDMNAQYSLTYSGSYDDDEMGPGDGVEIQTAGRNWRVNTNTIIDYGHSGLQITAFDSNELGVHDNIFEFNDVSSPNSPYCRGLGLSADEDLATGNIFRNNNIHECNIRSQITGNNNSYYNNKFINTTQSLRVANHSEAILFSGWIDGSDTAVCHDNEFYNNTISGVWNEGIAIETSNSVPVENNIIKNNIVIDAGQGGDHTNAAVYWHASVDESNTIEYNLFYDADTNDVVNYKGTAYTVAEADAGLTEFADNLSADPVFDGGNYALDATSPCIDEGVTLTDVVDDYRRLGRPQGDGYDIGAMEYGGLTAFEGVTLNGLTIQ